MIYEILQGDTVINTIVADAEFMATNFPDGNYRLAPQPPAPPEPPRYLTKLAFRNRFTPAEKVAIEIACLDDPSAPMVQRQQAAMLRASQADQRDATFINPKLPATRNGTLMLESAGILGVGRALQILDAPVTDDELFRG